MVRYTPSHGSDHLYQIWKESIQNCICYRADTIFKAKAQWPWRYRSRSKVMVRDTPSHGSDHLCLIWKESIHNCRCYRADTACGTDGQTDGRTEWNQYTHPTTSLIIIQFAGLNESRDSYWQPIRNPGINDSRCSPAFVTVDHKWKIEKKNIFLFLTNWCRLPIEYPRFVKSKSIFKTIVMNCKQNISVHRFTPLYV